MSSAKQATKCMRGFVLQHWTWCREVASSTAPAGHTSGAEYAALRKTCGSGGWAQKMNFTSLPGSTPQHPLHRLSKRLQHWQKPHATQMPWPIVVIARFNTQSTPQSTPQQRSKQLQPCRCCQCCRGVLPSNAANNSSPAIACRCCQCCQGVLPSNAATHGRHKRSPQY